MAQEYGARTSVPNTCSRRVFRSSNIRAKNGHSTGSYTGSTRPRSDWTVTPVEAPMSAAFALDPLAADLAERRTPPTRGWAAFGVGFGAPMLPGAGWPGVMSHLMSP